MGDPGSLFRAYDREVVDAVLASRQINAFVPALARTYALNPTEIEIDLEGRPSRESRWSLYDLYQGCFDLVFGFSRAPLQLFSLAVLGLSLASFAVVALLVVQGLILEVDRDGGILLSGILFFLVGIMLAGIGLLGGYVGRIYDQSRGCPLYLVSKHLRPLSDPDGPGN
jgi:undecaprenyl-phosphate 4-deoxy-4-formamido-L-arabinose transferase